MRVGEGVYGVCARDREIEIETATESLSQSEGVWVSE